MTDKMIRRFRMEGTLIETAMAQAQGTARLTLTQMMRDEGFVPLLDLDPVFKTSYIGGEMYEFSLTLHGVFVGREAACVIIGMLDGKLLPYTPKNK